MRGVVMFSILALAACTDSETVIQSQAEEADAIRQAEAGWAAAANAKDIAAWETFLAPEPTFIPPDVPVLAGREAILDFYRDLFADPNFAISCKTTDVEIASSGEMAWSRGTCEATFTNEGGGPQIGVGSRWVKAWEKQADGSWAGKINTWNYGS